MGVTELQSPYCSSSALPERYVCVHGLVRVYTTVCAHSQAGSIGGVLYTWSVFLEANLI